MDRLPCREAGLRVVAVMHAALEHAAAVIPYLFPESRWKAVIEYEQNPEFHALAAACIS